MTVFHAPPPGEVGILTFPLCSQPSRFEWRQLVELSSESEVLTPEPVILLPTHPRWAASLPRSEVPYAGKDEKPWAGLGRPGIPLLPDLAAVGPGHEDL